MNFAESLNAIADPQRLKLFRIIIKESRLSNIEQDSPAYRGNCSKRIAQRLRISQSTLSHHTSIMEKAGLITRKKQGKWEHFFPNFEKLNEIEKGLKELTSLQRIKEPELIKTFQVQGNFNEKKFRELISLIENHEYRRIHITNRDIAMIAYMRKSQDESAVFHLIYNPQTNVITLKAQDSGQTGDHGASDLLDLSDLPDLIEKYIPSLR